MRKSLALESGCALFAALCKEDLIFSQPMTQLTLMPVLWTYTLGNFSVLTWDRASNGIISWTLNRWSYRFIDRGSHLCWKCLGFDSMLSSEEDDEWEEKLLGNYRGTICSELVIHVGPKLFQRSSNQRDRRRALLPRCQRHRAGICFVGCGLTTPKPPLTPVAAELDKLKELYKKKENKDLKTWQNTYT